jgi:hypothetical protein
MIPEQQEPQRQEEQRRQKEIKIEELRQKELMLIEMHPEFEQIASYLRQNNVGLISGVLKRDFHHMVAPLKEKAAYEIFKQDIPTQIMENEKCFNCSVILDKIIYPIGYLQFNKEKGKKKSVYISEFYVDRPVRGTEISDFFIKSAIFYAQTQHAADVYLTVSFENNKAMYFFEQNGFKRIRNDFKQKERHFKFQLDNAQLARDLKKISFEDDIDRLFTAYQQQRKIDKQTKQSINYQEND